MLRRTQSHDVFDPPFEPPACKGEVYGVMNLVGTIIGGGVLSLPWAFWQAGVVVGLSILIVSATWKPI
jgi:amino acid permease